MDNFEWAFGYRIRFSLVYVDFATQKRIVQDSGRWYTRVTQSNTLDMEA
jgi:beta-glucosidase